MIPYMKTCSVYDSLYEDTVVCMIPYMKTLVCMIPYMKTL